MQCCGAYVRSHKLFTVFIRFTSYLPALLSYILFHIFSFLFYQSDINLIKICGYMSLTGAYNDRSTYGYPARTWWRPRAFRCEPILKTALSTVNLSVLFRTRRLLVTLLWWTSALNIWTQKHAPWRVLPIYRKHPSLRSIKHLLVIICGLDFDSYQFCNQVFNVRAVAIYSITMSRSEVPHRIDIVIKEYHNIFLHFVSFLSYEITKLYPYQFSFKNYTFILIT